VPELSFVISPGMMMKTLTALFLLLFAATSAYGQTPAYVTYDNARLYAEADYLSEVVDTLAIGDTVVALEREKKFVHVRFGGKDGWVLAANVSDRAPKAVKRKEADAAAVKDAAPRSESSSRSSSTASSSTSNSSSSRSDEASTAQCAATTKSGKQCSRKAGAGSSYCWQHAK
jgi:hypothetical protein